MNNRTNTLELVTVAFAAGESRLFALNGSYFELIDCPSPVNVILSDVNGSQRVRLMQGEASFYSKDVDFAVIQITSATTQVIRFAFGTGEAGTRRSTGSVTVSGAVALDAATLAALEQTSVRPEAASGFFNSAAALSAGVAETVFTAVTNANGAILLAANAHIYEPGATPHVAGFFAKATAPTTTSDAAAEPLMLTTQICVNGAFIAAGKLEVVQYIPAGKGLFYVDEVATPANAYTRRSARYKLL
ncbi:MAG: hypothetical protein U5M53_13735 [Rhodoferax sp.]|nr:hypothetical protein [Rhodoferax sp.]